MPFEAYNILMPVLYESEEDQKRAQALHNKQGRHFRAVQLSTYLSACGLGLVGSGFLRQNETHKNIGWITTITGLVGFIYNYMKGAKRDKELNKPENANVILHGTPLSPIENTIRDRAEAIGLLKPSRKGQLLPPDTEIIQGRKAWEERMAKENAKCSGQAL